MRWAAKTGLVVLLAAGFVTERAVAQAQAEAQPAGDDGAAMKAGAEGRQDSDTVAVTTPGDSMKVRLENPFRLSIELSGVYTDNRDSTTNKESDFDLVAVPRIAAGLSGRRGLLDFNYAPPFRYRSNPSDYQRSFDMQQALELRAELNATPEARLRVHENFYYTDDPTVDQSRGSMRGNRSYILNYLEAGGNWKFARWSSVDAYARQMTKKYDDKVVGANANEDGLEGGLAVWRQVGKTVGVQAIAKLTDHNFSNDSDVNRGTDILLGAVRTEKSLGPNNLRGAVSLGAQQVSYKNASLKSGTGGYGAVELNGDILRILRATATYTHGLSEADVQPYASQEYDELVARMDYRASGKVSLGGSCAYRLSKYSASTVPANATPVAGGNETTLSAGVDVTVKIGSNSSVKLAQVYSDVNSDVSYSFRKNTTSLSLVATF